MAKMGPFTETAVSIIGKDQFAYLKDDEGFISHVVNELSRRLADRIVGILDSEDEIIVKQSDLRVSEYLPENTVEYRRRIEWQPLVRCKDCTHKEREQPGMVYCPMMVGSWVADDHFCKWGERREDGGGN